MTTAIYPAGIGLGAAIIAITIFVHTETYKDEVGMARERLAPHMKCAEKDKDGYQLVATARGYSDWDPVSVTCFYKESKQ